MRRLIISTLNELGHHDVAEAATARWDSTGRTPGRVDVIITDWEHARNE
jgi:hypothetical protein